MAWLDWDGPSKGLCGGDPLGPISICSGPFWLTGLGDPLVRGESPTSFIFFLNGPLESLSPKWLFPSSPFSYSNVALTWLAWLIDC